MNIEWGLQGIARKDRAAFSWLYASDQAPLLRHATGMLAGDCAAAEDAVDEAFIAVWQQAGRFRGSAGHGRQPRTDCRGKFRRAMERLSPDHREVVWLCHFEEQPWSEIAHQVGCPENTVKTRLFHARWAMRTALAALAPMAGPQRPT